MAPARRPTPPNFHRLLASFPRLSLWIEVPYYSFRISRAWPDKCITRCKPIIAAGPGLMPTESLQSCPSFRLGITLAWPDPGRLGSGLPEAARLGRKPAPPPWPRGASSGPHGSRPWAPVVARRHHAGARPCGLAGRPIRYASRPAPGRTALRPRRVFHPGDSGSLRRPLGPWGAARPARLDRGSPVRAVPGRPAGRRKDQ
jgi:hypothetical protein